MESLSGFVKLFRSMLSWEWHDDPHTLSVFVHLLLLASFRPSTWHGMEIGRGQAIIGRKNLAELTGLSEQQVRTALKRLKSTGEITTKSTNKFTVVTIENYGKYQDICPEANQQVNQQIPSNQPATNQQLTTSEEGKEIKKMRGAIAPLMQQEQPDDAVTVPPSYRTAPDSPAAERKRFTPPTLEEVRAYCAERGNQIDPETFTDFYEARGWKLSRGAGMKDWKAAVRTWEKREQKESKDDDEPWY